MKRRPLRTTLIAATALAGFMSMANAQDKAPVNEYKELERFGAAIDMIKNSYVEEVEFDELIDAAINGMLSSLDPHSSYLDEDAIGEMMESATGEFAGLGIQITQEDGLVKVIAPIDDTPATEVGLFSGDFITHVDGESLIGLTIDEAINKLRGPIGSTITITIVREGEAEPFDVEITRDIVKSPSARVYLEGDVAVIRISQFNEQSYPNMLDGLETVHEEIGGKDKVAGYIVDLRSNPGGLLTTAIEISDAFLDQGEIVSTRGRNENDTSRSNATQGDIAGGKPVVVLIDGGSASASEIVAGALKDHHRAVIVGTTSFGKGSVQSIIPIEQDAALRLTTSRYYTPSGRSIQSFGVEPDVYIEWVPPAKTDDEDAPRSEAFTDVHENDLRGALTNDSLTEEEIEMLEAERAEREQATELRKTDIQMAYAIDIINSLAVFKEDE